MNVATLTTRANEVSDAANALVNAIEREINSVDAEAHVLSSEITTLMETNEKMSYAAAEKAAKQSTGYIASALEHNAATVGKHRAQSKKEAAQRVYDIAFLEADKNGLS